MATAGVRKMREFARASIDTYDLMRLRSATAAFVDARPPLPVVLVFFLSISASDGQSVVPVAATALTQL